MHLGTSNVYKEHTSKVKVIKETSQGVGDGIYQNGISNGAAFRVARASMENWEVLVLGALSLSFET